MSKLAKVGIGMLGTRKAITVRYFLQTFLWCGTHTFAKWSKKHKALEGSMFSEKQKSFPRNVIF